MKESKEILKHYVSDMLGVEKHILEAVERQTRDSRVRQFQEAYEMLMTIETKLSEHVVALERHMASMDVGGAESQLKKLATSALGAMAGVYDKIRSEDAVSRNLRDDYTALNLAAVSYTMLHTTALAFKETALADLAIKHLTELTPLIAGISRVIPPVVAHELAAEGKTFDASVGREAVENTQRAWSREVIG